MYCIHWGQNIQSLNTKILTKVKKISYGSSIELKHRLTCSLRIIQQLLRTGEQHELDKNNWYFWRIHMLAPGTFMESSRSGGQEPKRKEATSKLSWNKWRGNK
jgi:hypothetical protein